jgi:hypothetical protein
MCKSQKPLLSWVYKASDHQQPNLPITMNQCHLIGHVAIDMVFLQAILVFKHGICPTALTYHKHNSAVARVVFSESCC